MEKIKESVERDFEKRYDEFLMEMVVIPLLSELVGDGREEPCFIGFDRKKEIKW